MGSALELVRWRKTLAPILESQAKRLALVVAAQM